MNTNPLTLQPPSNLSPTGLSYSKSHLINSHVFIEISTGITIPEFKSDSHREKCLAKIRYTLTEIQESIEKAKKDGKYILMLPGSFDLLHIGHVAYIEKSIDTFCKKTKCERKEVFLVVLVDEDILIQNVKAYKHVDFGGNEMEKRPVETSAERLVSLSSIDEVDIVGLLPAPIRKKSLPKPIEIPTQDMISSLINTYKPQIEAGIKEMELDKKIERKYLLQAHNDIEELKTGLVYYDFMQKNWDSDLIINYPVQAWQLYIMSIINSTQQVTEKDVKPLKRSTITRFVNTEDVKYLNQVMYLMNIVDISIVLFEYKLPEKSTSETIQWAMSKADRMKVSEKISPWEIIKKHKRESFEKETYKEYRDAVAYVEKRMPY